MKQDTAFYLLTDTHYVSRRNRVLGKPFTFREREDQIALEKSPEILDEFLAKILADNDTDTVIFLGDNVNNGDRNSHIEFREKLARLVNAGKKVYVTYATHDYCGMGDDENFFEALRYTAEGTEPLPCMRKNELFDFYYDYGPKQACSVHRESGSYTVRLGEGVRLIALIDNGNGRSHCGLFDDGTAWLEGELAAAAAAGDSVLLAVHHPVLPPWEIYRHLCEFELYGGYETLKKLLCRYGVRAVFTGHTHVQSIRRYADGTGSFYDISTIAAVNAAGKMRRVTVDGATRMCEVTSVGFESIPYEELYHLNFPGIWEKLLPLAAEDYGAFLALAEGYLPLKSLKKHRAVLRLFSRKLLKMNLLTAAKLGGIRRRLTPEERREAKEKSLADTVFVIFRHIYTGNAPFPPATIEHRVITALAKRADTLTRRLRIKKITRLIPRNSSLTDVVQDFLYNNRTGDDDTLRFSLQ